MPIMTPAERRNLWTEDDQAQLDRLEALVNVAMDASDDETASVDVTGENARPRVLERLRRDAQDWTIVGPTTDPETCKAWLTFTAKGAPRSSP